MTDRAVLRDIAEHLVFDLVPQGGKSWAASELMNGHQADLTGTDYKVISRMAHKASQGRVVTDAFNRLFFRQDVTLTDPTEVSRYLPNADWPAGGLRMRERTDDPVTLFQANRLAARAGATMPNAARKLEGQVETGQLSEKARDEAAVTAQRRFASASREVGSAAVQRMLPSA